MRYRLSPYCLFHAMPGSPDILVIHSRYGTKFEISAEVFATLGAIASPQILDIGSGLIDQLIEEQILITEAQFQEASNNFIDQLSPLELAFQREFTEGGYFPDRLTSKSSPPPTKSYQISKSVPLKTHSSLPLQDLSSLLAHRHSTRAYTAKAMPLASLEKFLQLTARAYAWTETSLGASSLRNYPSGGGRYPLELHLVVDNVRGLSKGIYHYRPFTHRLDFLGAQTKYRQALQSVAAQRMASNPATDGQPAVLFLVTAVFTRSAWKYRGIPLQLILQEVGALYQTMCLVAESLNLAACPVGCFPERAVAEILGLDSHKESQVGFFTLGMPAPPKSLIIESFAYPVPDPFHPTSEKSAIKLHFSNGTKEILPIASFKPTLNSLGQLEVPVLRGRHIATFTAESQFKLQQRLPHFSARPNKGL